MQGGGRIVGWMHSSREGGELLVPGFIEMKIVMVQIIKRPSLGC
jgi:hypothetical protein